MKKTSQLIHTQVGPSQFKENSSALYLSSSFCFDDADEMSATFQGETDNNIYSRFTNPNFDEFIHRLCILEGAETGVGTATGMAAIQATFGAHLEQGDEIISTRAIFGSTHSVFTKVLPKFGIKTIYGNGLKLDDWDALVTENTKMVYAESPSNPTLDIVDIKALSAFCKKHKLLLVIDNCFASPIVQTPIDLGADFVIHSATKFIDGQGRVLGGAVLGREELIEPIANFVRATGPSISPFNAWVLSKSLELLELRMERHASNALYLAEKLSSHPKIKQLKYPGLPSHPQYEIAASQMKNGGGLFAFELSSLEEGKRFLNKLKMCRLTANLGDVRTIVSHPSSTTHSKLSEEERLDVGITPGFVRVSVGLEDKEDILNDLLQAIGDE